MALQFSQLEELIKPSKDHLFWVSILLTDLKHPSQEHLMNFFTPFCFVFVPQVAHELGEKHQVRLGQMWTCVLYALQIGIELLANLRVDTFQCTHPLAFEAFSTFMVDAVEKIVPEASTTEKFGLSIQAILVQIACKIIKDLFWCCRFVLENSTKGIFPSLTPINQMEPVQVTVDWAKHAHHVAKTSPGHLQITN